MTEQTLAYMQHVAITVDHIKSAIAWYRTHVPFQERYEDGGYLIFTSLGPDYD